LPAGREVFACLKSPKRIRKLDLEMPGIHLRFPLGPQASSPAPIQQRKGRHARTRALPITHQLVTSVSTDSADIAPEAI
jgi:hypothetical protein